MCALCSRHSYLYFFFFSRLFLLLFFGSGPSIQTEGTSDGIGYATDMAVNIPQGLTQYLGKSNPTGIRERL